MAVRRLIILAGWALLSPRIRAAANDHLLVEPRAAAQQSPDGTAIALNSSCTSNNDCRTINAAICNETAKVCQCSPDFVGVGKDKCLPGKRLNETCEHTEQCSWFNNLWLCSSAGFCTCVSSYKLTNSTDGNLFCKEEKKAPSHDGGAAKVDVTMLAVLISLVVMFLIMCVVLRMFSKAQFREQRTIFNSPRMMKKSLSKARAERRSSHASVGSRAGSRHASIQSGLNLAASSPKHSPRNSRESISLPNSNSVKHPAPIAEDDDTVVRIVSPNQDGALTGVKGAESPITAV